ncbi:MAG: hypothetical protein ACTH31_08425 [Pseudoclavibacter sp.]
MAGRLPASVYRRRRITVAVIAIVVIAFVWWAIAAVAGAVSGNADANATPVATTAAEATAAAGATPSEPPETTAPASDDADATDSPTPTPTGPQDCAADTMIVEAFTDASSYAEGAQPQLTLRVTNAGESACVMDIGTATQVYTISSGADQIWTSTDCQENPTNEVVQIEAGQSLDAPAVSWVRERSAPETCDGERPAAVAGGATYNLTVSIGGFTSGPTAFVLE